MGGRSGSKRRKAAGATAQRGLTATELHSLFEGGPALSAAVDREGRLLYCSPALAAMLGEERPAGDKPLTELIETDAPGGRLGDAIERAIDEGVSSAIEAWVRSHPDASRRLLEARVTPFARRDAVAAAVHLAQIDDLLAPEHTPFVSARAARAEFLQRVARSIERAEYDDAYHFAIMLVDVDNFELVDHSLGYVRGDEFLAAVARRIQRSLRPRDQVTHLGGHEFAIVVDGLSEGDAAARVAHRLQRAFRQPFRLDGQEVFTTVSSGIASSSTRYRQPEDALRDAGTALARARSRGPGRIELFDPQMRDRAIERLRLETDLRLAVERSEFRLHYQPELSLTTGEVIGFEALVRWQHPERGLVPPGLFIPAAEQTRLIVPITEWVFQEACRRMVDWRERFRRDPPLSISVNLAPLLFTESLLLPTLLTSLEQTGIDAETMIVEITESALMTDFELVLGQLSELRGKGIRVHLDDFGTGFSSLNYLSRLPADAVKIDRSFVGRMAEDADAETMVGAIIELAHRMGKVVIAEGIEEASQAERLRSLGCEIGQGYLFARPMAADGAESWLAAARPGHGPEV